MKKIIILLFSLSILIGGPILAMALKSPFPTLPNFSFGVAGDWSNNTYAKYTANSMANHQVELAIGLGDYCYCYTVPAVDSWWTNTMAPLHGKFIGALGNHDLYDVKSEYAKLFGLDTATWYYSFNYHNVHFLAIDVYYPYGVGSKQYEFASRDLQAASTDPNIKWIVVFFHEPIYTSRTMHPPLASLRDTYHPLFDKYHVDLVLQGHNHDYQRTYPLMYDANSPSNPIITDMNRNIYKHPSGEVYAVVGTGGEETYPFGGLSSYVATQFTGIHGYLNIDIINNGKTLKGTFYCDDGTIRDSFTINK